MAGAWQIPHPEKFHHGAWEGCFLCSGGSGVGIFELFEVDRNRPVDPIKAVQAMTAAGRKVCERTKLHAGFRASDRAAECLRDGCRSSGSSAACAGITAMLNTQGTELGVARLGEPMLWQVRKTPGTPVTGSHAKVVAHAGEAHQISSHPVHDGPEKAELYTFSVQEGDLLVLGSDGVFANLHDHEVCELLEWTVSPFDARQTWHEGTESLRGAGLCTDPERIAAAIAKAAFHRARDKLADTPVAARATQ